MLKLIQRLTHGCTTLDFMDMDMDTMDMLHSPTPMSTLTMASHTLTMARDLLMPSQRPMQRLTLLSSTAITDILTLMVMDTDMLDSHTLTTHTPTMERDLLMLSQRPRLMLKLTHIFSMVDTTDLTLIMPDTTHTPTDTHTPMDFGAKSKSKLSHSLLK